MISPTYSPPATNLFQLALDYARIAGADFCEGLQAVAAGSDRAQAVGGPGDQYLLLTITGWQWAAEPQPEDETTDADRWENELESRWEDQRNYA